MQSGYAIRSTRSSQRGNNRKGSCPLARPTKRLCCGESISISWDCRRLATSLRRSWPMIRRALMRKWSTGSWRVRNTASAGPATGWMFGATAIGPDTKRKFATAPGTSGDGAIGSSSRSMRIRATTACSPKCWQAMKSRPPTPTPCGPPVFWSAIGKNSIAIVGWSAPSNTRPRRS